MRNINGTTTTGDQDGTISNHSCYHLNDIGHLFFVENNIGTSLLDTGHFFHISPAQGLVF